MTPEDTESGVWIIVFQSSLPRCSHCDDIRSDFPSLFDYVSILFTEVFSLDYKQASPLDYK